MIKNRFILSVAILMVLSCGNLFAQESTSYLDSLARVREILLERNAVGTKATDINLMTIDGEDTSLFQIESELTLLYLYHPDCYACVATIQYFRDNETLKCLLKEKRIKILAVDLTPEMISISENILPPKGWTLCFNYDASINNRLLYYTEDYPSIYLMDQDKMILLKNPSAAEFIKYLEENFNEKNQ